MPFEAFVALRYLRGKRKNRVISIITLISVAGVTVGVMALIVVISVMTGFDRMLIDTVIGTRSHLTVQEPMRQPMLHPEKVMAEIEKLCPEVIASSPFIAKEVMLKDARAEDWVSATGAYLIGIDPELESAVTRLADHISHRGGRKLGTGSLPVENKTIVLSYGVASRLGGVHIGDKITVYSGRASMTPWMRRTDQGVTLTVCGIAEAGMWDFDELYTYVNLDTARRITGIEGVDGVHCRLQKAEQAAAVRDRVQEQLGYVAATWYDSQESFFQALVQEKVMMFIILMFIVMVAAFNIMSSLIMVVMEKRRDIGILRTIGVSARSIMLIFMLQGLYVGLSGAGAGVILGTFFAYNLNPIAEFVAHWMGYELYNSQIYYFDRIPVVVAPNDVALITVSAIALTFLATLYPAWSATRLDPVDALREE